MSEIKYPTTPERVNFARLSRAIVDLCTDVLRYILTGEIKPEKIDEEVQKNLKDKTKKKENKHIRMFPDEKTKIDNAKDNGYDEFDIELLYKAIRYLCINIQPPKENWHEEKLNNFPKDDDKTIGSDIERIRKIRNTFYAHAGKARVSNDEFEEHWTFLEHIMKRMTQKLQQPYDRHLEDIKRTEMDDALQQRYIDLLRKLNQLEKERCKDPVPQNVRENYNSTLKKWENEDMIFYETRGAKEVKNATSIHLAVTVTGNAGSGKTAMIHHIALEYRKIGYDILPVRTPGAIYEYHQKDKKQMFVLDDPVGVHGLDEAKLRNWIDEESKFNQFVSGTDTKFLFSIRKQVLNDKEFKTHDCLLRNEIINIGDSEYKLNNHEKINMIKLHVRIMKIECEITQEAEGYIRESPDLFPLCCKMFCSSSDFRKWEFFKEPLKLISKDLDKMLLYDIEKYCTLVACFANENNLVPKMFSPFSIDRKLKQKTEPFIRACGYKGDIEVVFSSIASSAKSLNGVYLEEKDGKYKFSHDLIYDVVALHFGRTYPEEVINLCPSKFICSRVCVSSPPEHDELVIALPKDNVNDLIKRLLTDVEKGIYNHVFMNKCWHDEIFFKAFIRIAQNETGVLQLFTQSKQSNRNEIDQEIKDIENCGELHTWSWRYLTMKSLVLSGITPLHWIVAFALKELFCYIWENLSTDQKHSVITTDQLLHPACQGGNLEICNILLNASNQMVNTPYYPENKSSLHELPLHYAACGNVDVVKLLIPLVDDINSKTPTKGRTAVFLAAGQGKTDIVMELIQGGADINLSDKSKWSPIMIAVQNNHIEVTKVLLQHNANVKLRLEDECSTLMIAAQYNRAEIIRLLLNHADDIINHKDEDGWSALMFAADKNLTEALKVLLDDDGCDVNLQDCDGDVALIVACEKNHTETMKLLLNDSRCNINVQNEDGWSALMIAAYKNLTEALKVLLNDDGCDVNLQDCNGTTALMVACEENRTEAVKLLLNDSRCDINTE